MKSIEICSKSGWKVIFPPKARTHISGAHRRAGTTLQFFGVHWWQPPVAQMCMDLQNAVDRPCSVNMYITPPGVPHSLHAHSDLQCILVVQLRGAKRWRLWRRAAVPAGAASPARPVGLCAVCGS